MTGSTTGEESFIAKNMDANYHGPSAGGVGTPNGHYFGGMTQTGGEGLNSGIGGKLGQSMEGFSIDNAIKSGQSLDNVLGSFQGDAMSANPFNMVDRFMPVQNLSTAGQALQKTGDGLSGLAKLNSVGGAINADLRGHTSFVSSPGKGGGMQAG
ncbi:MAG: hypothetical protein ACKO47_05865 [Alphaproteobacteria bacterium]